MKGAEAKAHGIVPVCSGKGQKFESETASRDLISPVSSERSAGSTHAVEVHGSQRCRCFWQCASRYVQQNEPLSSLPLWRYTHIGQTVCAGSAFVVFLGLAVVFRLSSNSLPDEIVVPYRQADGQSTYFTIDKDISGDVFVYYELPDVNMNQKSFVESKDKQVVTTFFSSVTCSDADDRGWAEFRRGNDSNFTARIDAAPGTNLVPCGLVSLSFFTDRYRFFHQLSDSSWSELAADSSDVALPADAKTYAHKVSIDSDGRLEMSGVKSWLTADDYEHWKVWYRTPASPGVRNLYAVIQGGMAQGSYKVEFAENSGIWEAWGVAEKRIVLAETNGLGSKRGLEIMFTICVTLATLEFAACVMFGSDAIAKRNVSRSTASHDVGSAGTLMIVVKPKTIGTPEVLRGSDPAISSTSTLG